MRARAGVRTCQTSDATWDGVLTNKLIFRKLGLWVPIELAPIAPPVRDGLADVVIAELRRVPARLHALEEIDDVTALNSVVLCLRRLELAQISPALGALFAQGVALVPMSVTEAAVREEMAPIAVLLLPDVQLLRTPAGFAHRWAAARGQVPETGPRRVVVLLLRPFARDTRAVQPPFVSGPQVRCTL
jgi:hypothetical protein